MHTILNGIANEGVEVARFAALFNSQRCDRTFREIRNVGNILALC